MSDHEDEQAAQQAAQQAAADDKTDKQTAKLEKLYGILISKHNQLRDYKPYDSIDLYAKREPQSMGLCFKKLEVVRSTLQDAPAPVCTSECEIFIEQLMLKYPTAFRRRAFNQIVVDTNTGELLTVATPEGYAQPTRLPFGIKTAPKIFQSNMDKLIHGMDDPDTVAAIVNMPPPTDEKTLSSFLDCSALKRIFGPKNDLGGLLEPVPKLARKASQHVYISLSEVQIKQEEAMTRNPMSQPEDDVSQTPAEVLYQAMLPTLPQCMIALLKILLAAAPTSKAKTDSINIMADVLPEEMPMTVVQSMKLGLDVNRHKEVLVKAVSASLFLLLKHFRLNHVYQFEFMSQHLVFANCIPLILKFFNQNIMAYVQAKNTIALLDFPAFVIGDTPEMTAEALESSTGGGGSGSPSGTGENMVMTGACCWRNMFSCTNLLRILNKLCKWKHSRIMMLVVFKSAPILKRTLKV
ncbi:unnamed protein product, partial [Meganyctiphanes norvegica]